YVHKQTHEPSCSFFYFTDTATTEIYTLSLHDALPISADRAGALAHAGEAKALTRVHIGSLQQPYAVVRDRELPVGGLIGHGDAHRLRAGMPHRIAHGLLRDAQQLVLVLRTQARRGAAAFEGAGDAAGHRGAVGELPERDLQSRAPGLIQAQRHHRAARFGEPVARQRADAR